MGLRKWLSKGELATTSTLREMLQVVVQCIGCSTDSAGLAALRLWGQTGDKSAAWVMAADPVHMEARLDHLCMHTLVGQIPRPELRALYEDLQARLGSAEFSFARIGDYGYVRAVDAQETAPFSSIMLDGLPPGEFFPESKSLHSMLSEVQMFLHDHGVNAERASRGLMPVNSLWFWGGGIAPDARAAPIFPLFADDPLFRGFWFSRKGVAEPWSGDFDAMAEFSERGFVAVSPESSDPDGSGLLRMLDSLRRLLNKNRISRLTLCFRDGVTAELRKSDQVRIWRGVSPLLESR